MHGARAARQHCLDKRQKNGAKKWRIRRAPGTSYRTGHNRRTMSAPFHRSEVFATPWDGIHGTALDSGRHFERHWHEVFGLGLLEMGAQRSASGRGVVDACAGQLITSNPGEVHDGQPLGDAPRRWRMLYLEPVWLGELALTDPVITDARLRAALERLFARLARWRSARDDVTMLACDEALAALLALLVAGHSTARPVATVDARVDLRVALERLADLAMPAPSLAVLAALAGLSRFQLLRRFEAQLGLPPHAWLLQRRAEEARRLVARGFPLAEAAGAAGFADQSHMTREFARRYGFTPGQLRRALATP